MDHTEIILISLLNLSSNSVESIHSSSDESNHLSIFVTLGTYTCDSSFDSKIQNQEVELGTACIPWNRIKLRLYETASLSKFADSSRTHQSISR